MKLGCAIIRQARAPALACWLALAASSAIAETVYVSNEQDNTVSVIDGRTLAVSATIPVGRRPRGIGLSLDKSKLYVAVGDDNRIDDSLTEYKQAQL